MSSEHSLRRLFVVAEPEYDTAIVSLPNPPPPSSPTSSLAPELEDACPSRTKPAVVQRPRILNETDGLGSQAIAFVLGCPTFGITPWSGTTAEKLRASRVYRLASLRFVEEHVRVRLAGMRICLSDPITRDGSGTSHRRRMHQSGSDAADEAVPESVLATLAAATPAPAATTTTTTTTTTATTTGPSILQMPDLAQQAGAPGSEAAALEPRPQGLRVHDDSVFLRGPELQDDADRGVVETCAPPATTAIALGPDAVPTHLVPRRAGTLAATEALWSRLRYEGCFDWQPMGVVARDSESSHLQHLAGTLLKQLGLGQQVDVTLQGRAHCHEWAEAAAVHGAVAWREVAREQQHLADDAAHDLPKRATLLAAAHESFAKAIGHGTPVPNAHVYVLLTGVVLLEDVLVQLGKGEGVTAPNAHVQTAAKTLVEFARASTTTFDESTQAAMDLLFAASREMLDVASFSQTRTPPRATLVRPRMQRWTFGAGQLPKLRRTLVPAVREVVLGGWRLGRVLDSKATQSGVVELHVDVSGFLSGDQLAQRYHHHA